MNTKMNTPGSGRDNLSVKAANIHKLEDQRDKALSFVKILQESVFIANATRKMSFTRKTEQIAVIPKFSPVRIDR